VQGDTSCLHTDPQRDDEYTDWAAVTAFTEGVARDLVISI